MEIVWSRKAIEDLENHFKFISGNNIAIAIKTYQKIKVFSLLLEEQPYIGRVSETKFKDTRELIIPKTPYILIYRITSQIEILRLFHGSQNWKI